MELPRIIWTWKKKDEEIRLVQVAKGRVTPEQRLPDDAMGNPCWGFTQWDSKWMNDLALEYVSVLGGEQDPDEAV